MSVIIRLQNLPWSANAADVRGFFRGLGIPDGGVHIVGGENGDAFIAFSTDEDARQAMMLNGSKLKETQVSLLLSSRAEMQKVIETARQQTMSFMNFSAQQPTVTATTVLPTIAPQISMPGLQAQSSILNGSNSVVGLMDPQLIAPKPQPPVITSSSLSGILAQQMLQQHQIQLIRQQQNMPVLTSTSVRHDTYKSAMSNQYNSIGHQYSDNSMDAKNMQANDSKRNRMSRSRSRSRDRRKRSRSRERSRRHRRSRSRERDRRRRRRSHSSDRRSRSRGRDRNSRDSVRKDRSYDKDVRPSLDRNKSIDGSITNFNSSVENNSSAQLGNVDQPMKSSNYSDTAGSTNNFNNAPNQFNSQLRTDYPANILNDFDSKTAMVPFKESNNLNNIGSCIRITNMNNRTHYAAIRKFFYGLQIPNDGIKLLNDENGKRKNVVVIRFARPDIARDALDLDGKMLNGNAVRISSITDAEYENEVDSFQPASGRNTGRFGSRYDDKNYGGDRGRSEENNRDGRRNNRDYYDRGYNRSRFNDDSDGHGNHSNDSRDRRDDDDDVMLITDSNDGEPTPVGLTLLIEDLPPFAKEQDIIKMFSDFTLMDIMLAKVNKAFRAYVKFHNQTDAEAALKQTHLHRIDFKSVYVSPCSEDTYEKAKQEYDGIGDTTMGKPETNPSNEPSRDEPHQNYNDRDEFRNDSSQADNEVDQFGRSIRNRKFVNQQPQQQQQQQPAPENKSQIPSLFNLTFDPPFIANQQIESKFVPADPRLRRHFDQSNNSQSPDSQLSPNSQQAKAFNPFNQQGRIDPRLQRNLPNFTNNSNTKIVFIGNVEYNTSEADMCSFFADIGAIPDGVFFVKNARGQPCGDCYVKFKSADDASKALIKNRFRFRTRVIRVTLAEPDEAAKVLGFSLGDDNDQTNSLSDNVIESIGKGMATDENSSEKNDKDDNKEMDMDDGQNAEHDGDQSDGGGGGGDDDEDGDSNGRFDRVGRREDPRMMYNALHSRSNGDRSAMNPGNINNNYYRGGGSDNGRGGRGNYNNPNNVQRNLDGCIVSLSNVPFAATPRDIADFFGEYNLGPNDIIRRYNDDGSLTGEARVRFLTPTDATEAIERHNRERIRNRVIHLRLFT